MTYPTRSTTEAARAGSPGLVRVRWCWEWLELLRPHEGMGVISPTDRLEKRSGIIQGLFLPPFLQEFCSAWWHAGTQTVQGWEGVLGTTQPSLVWRCRGKDSQRGRQGFYRSCPACCFSACWKSLCWFFTENKTLPTSPYDKQQTRLVLIATRLSPFHICPWTYSHRYN